MDGRPEIDLCRRDINHICFEQQSFRSLYPHRFNANIFSFIPTTSTAATCSTHIPFSSTLFDWRCVCVGKCIRFGAISQERISSLCRTMAFYPNYPMCKFSCSRKLNFCRLPKLIFDENNGQKQFMQQQLAKHRHTHTHAHFYRVMRKSLKIELDDAFCGVARHSMNVSTLAHVDSSVSSIY